MRRWMPIPSLDESSTTHTNEARAQVATVSMTDGPYAETKELLGSRARHKPKLVVDGPAARALVMVALTSSVATACAGGHPTPQQELRQAGALEPHVEALIARARSATAPYHVLDSAVAAGYVRHVAQCVENQPLGAMGYHHVNRALLDDSLDVEHPEILVYGRDGGGAYKLNGVEYIVPYRVRPPDAEPPRVMGQTLKRADNLRLWYLHVWLWEPNPSGMFADWNPVVRC